METNWILKKAKGELLYNLSEQIDSPLWFTNCLINRGMQTKEDIEKFLDFSINDLHDPFLFNDMKKCVTRVNDAINNKEHIRVFGDYDVDGVTSTAIIAYALQKMKANFSFYTPHRITDGYDLKAKHIEEAEKLQTKVMISVDCGIRAVEAAKKAKELNIDLIITDHHLPNQENIPDAFGIISPHLKNSTYPYPHLAGCGIALKFVLALATIRKVNLEKIFDHLLDYVTLGTVADMAPLTGENRILVNLGCERLINTTKTGVKELFKVADIKDKIDTTSIGFYLGPRINAIGRLGDSFTALQLLLEEDQQKAVELAKQLNTANDRRQTLQEQTFKEALALLPEDMSDTFIVLLSAKNWHSGIVGLVASKITEVTGLPSLIGIEKDHGIVKGSCRSTSGFSIIDALNHFSEYFINFGGHTHAAGFEITKDNFIKLQSLMNDYAKNLVGKEQSVKHIYVDYKMLFSDITQSLLDQINLLSPFGMDNSEPIFQTNNLNIKDITFFGQNKKYSKFKLQNENNHYLQGIWWKPNKELLEQEDLLEKKVNVVYKIKKDEFFGKSLIYLSIEDIKLQ